MKTPNGTELPPEYFWQKYTCQHCSFEGGLPQPIAGALPVGTKLTYAGYRSQAICNRCRRTALIISSAFEPAEPAVVPRVGWNIPVE